MSHKQRSEAAPASAEKKKQKKQNRQVRAVEYLRGHRDGAVIKLLRPNCEVKAMIVYSMKRHQDANSFLSGVRSRQARVTDKIAAVVEQRLQGYLEAALSDRLARKANSLTAERIRLVRNVHDYVNGSATCFVQRRDLLQPKKRREYDRRVARASATADA